MTLTQITYFTQVTLAAGANSQKFATVYTVAAGKTLYIKEIIHSMQASAALTYSLYVLPTGVTDLTSTANQKDAYVRAFEDNVNVQQITPTTSSAAATAPTVLARNTVLNAGDKLNIWVGYGAVTPSATQINVIVSGDLV